LTVLLPVRHYQPEYLRRAAASILAQTSPRWRLLVVDDGADREMGAVLAPLLADPRARLVASEGRGLAAALNTGMREADTEYVAILLGDDLWSPDAVGVLARSIEENPEVDVFHSSRRFIDGDDAPISGIYPAREAVRLADFVHGSPVKHLLCWRRRLALELGGLDERLAVGPDDYDLPWTLCEHGARFMAVPECLYFLRDHRDSYRITTHLPLSVHLRHLRRMMRKHGVGRLARERALLVARHDYLHQCLFRNRLHRRLRERTGYDARRGWREPLQ
jgi:glycosyltransferase involved in cell wall biosynthesis